MDAARSRLQARLDADIAGARDPVVAACRRAERAALFARLGRAAEARADIDAVRRAFAAAPNAEVSAWLQLTEGLLDHFTDQRASAQGKVQRAQALAAAAGVRPLQALATAWLAHLAYGRCDDEATVRFAAEAIALAGPQDHAALARASLVVAYAWHVAGRPEPARPWYGRAREHALADGDEAALSALMHTQAALRAAAVRFADVFGEAAGAAGADARQAVLGAESSVAFDASIGARSLEALPALLRAQLFTVEGRHREAVALFEAYFEPAMAQGEQRARAAYLADMAWCQASLGRQELAQRRLDEALAGVHDITDTDDRALALGRLAQVAKSLGDARANELQARAQEALQAHRAQCEALAARLAAAFPSDKR